MNHCRSHLKIQPGTISAIYQTRRRAEMEVRMSPEEGFKVDKNIEGEKPNFEHFRTRVLVIFWY